MDTAARVVSLISPGATVALRCIDTHSRKSIHAFEFAPQDWQSLAAQNARERHLRAPCCQAEIILRRSKLGTQHFVHRFRGACTSAPESEDHRQVKRVIVEAARANGWHAEAEFDGLSSESEPWRADVLLTKGSVRIAIEVQWSNQSQEETARRQSRYASSGVRGLWLFRQARFDASKDIPAVRIGGNPLDGYDVFIRTGTGEQALPLSSFISAALNRRYQFGLPLNAPADVEVRCGNLDCWKCGAETLIVTGLDISIGPHRLSATIPDLGNCPDLVRRTLQAIPAQASLGRIMHRNSREAGSRYLSNGCAHCGALIGAHYEYQAWDHQDVVARFRTVVDERMRQLAIDLGDEPGWGVHVERIANRELSSFDRV